MGRLSSAEGTEGSAESEEVKQSNFRFHIEVIILFALNMYVQDLGLERRKMASFEKYISSNLGTHRYKMVCLWKKPYLQCIWFPDYFRHCFCRSPLSD